MSERTPPGGILMACATSVEAECFLRDVSGAPGELPAGVHLGVYGIGRAGDAPFAADLARYRPRLVLNPGFAGSLTDAAPGSTALIHRWFDPTHPQRVTASADASLTAALGELLRDAGIAAPQVGGTTVDAPSHDPARRTALAAAGLALVEMEGAQWATAAEASGAAFASLRVVSDRANLALPRPRHQLLRPDASVRWLRWLTALAQTSRFALVREARTLARARADWRAATAALAGAGAAIVPVLDALAAAISRDPQAS